MELTVEPPAWNPAAPYDDENGLQREDKPGGSSCFRGSEWSIEEWVSLNEGKTWRKERDLTPDVSEYPGWKYNNVQPVTNPD